MRTLGSYKLTQPIVLETRAADGEAREEELKPAGFCVVLRRPRAKDIKVFDDHGDRSIAAVMALLVRISNLDGIEVENLDRDDLEALGNLASGPGRGGQPTGTTA